MAIKGFLCIPQTQMDMMFLPCKGNTSKVIVVQHLMPVKEVFQKKLSCRCKQQGYCIVTYIRVYSDLLSRPASTTVNDTTLVG